MRNECSFYLLVVIWPVRLSSVSIFKSGFSLTVKSVIHNSTRLSDSGVSGDRGKCLYEAEQDF